MKLVIKLAFLNIKRYPLRTVSTILCLLFFSFFLFSSISFSWSLSDSIAESISLRSSGNTLVIKTDVKNFEVVKKNKNILEVFPLYKEDFVSGEISIEGMGKFDINAFIRQSADSKTLIPNTFINEFCALGGKNVLVAGRMPQNDNELIINSGYIKNLQITDYSLILEKEINIFHDYLGNEINDLDSGKIVGIYSQEFLNINGLHDYYDYAFCFCQNNIIQQNKIVTYCSADKIDRAYIEMCDNFGSENVIKTVKLGVAIEKLLGLRAFISKLMFLATAAITLIYILVQINVTDNYFREKKTFIRAADAFGCGKKHLIGVFAFEHMILLMPIFIFTILLGHAFVVIIFDLISAVEKINLSSQINIGISAITFIILIFLEAVVVIIKSFFNGNNTND